MTGKLAPQLLLVFQNYLNGSLTAADSKYDITDSCQKAVYRFTCGRTMKCRFFASFVSAADGCCSSRRSISRAFDVVPRQWTTCNGYNSWIPYFKNGQLSIVMFFSRMSWVRCRNVNCTLITIYLGCAWRMHCKSTWYLKFALTVPTVVTCKNRWIPTENPVSKSNGKPRIKSGIKHEYPTARVLLCALSSSGV